MWYIIGEGYTPYRKKKVQRMELKKIWKKAWDMGKKAAAEYETEKEAAQDMDMEQLENFAYVHGFSEFFHAGFIGREPEWVEAIRMGEIPENDYSINWADGTAEPGVSCVKIIRCAEDADAKTLYNITLADREPIRVAGWWLGLTGSDGEPTLLGVVKC